MCGEETTWLEDRWGKEEFRLRMKKEKKEKEEGRWSLYMWKIWKMNMRHWTSPDTKFGNHDGESTRISRTAVTYSVLIEYGVILHSPAGSIIQCACAISKVMYPTPISENRPEDGECTLHNTTIYKWHNTKLGGNAR